MPQINQGKAKTKLDDLKSKLKLSSNNEFTNADLTFLSSIGEAFPIYDSITLEAISGVTILDSSSEMVASYSLLQHLKEVLSEVRKAIATLKSKQSRRSSFNCLFKSSGQVTSFCTRQIEQYANK